MFINKLKITHKIAVLIIIGIIISVSFAFLNIVMGSRQIDTLENIYDGNVTPLDNLRKIQLSFREIEFYIISQHCGLAREVEKAASNLSGLAMNVTGQTRHFKTETGDSDEPGQENSESKEIHTTDDFAQNI